jgi:hypothetical protein
MPDFSKAEVADESTDLTTYRAFLKRLTVGQTVSLPLDRGKTSRKVMRHLNTAAKQSKIHLARLPAENGAVRFRVLPSEKRAVRLTDEAKRARVEKGRATRAARRAELEQLQAMGMPVEGEPPSTPPDQQVQEPDVQRPPSRSRRSRRPGAA